MQDITKVTVIYPNGESKQFQRGCRILDVMDNESLPKETLGVFVNGKAYSLNDRLDVGEAKIKPFVFESFDGYSIYRRSLVFLLSLAVYKTHPEFNMIVHNTNENGYVIRKRDLSNVTEEEVQTFKTKMTEYINKDISIENVLLAHSEALKYFKETDRQYTVSYLESNYIDKIKCTYADGYMNLYVRPLVKSTGILKQFDLIRLPKGDGMILLFPNKYHKTIDTNLDNIIVDNLNEKYLEGKKLGKCAEVECVGDLNKKIIQGKGSDFQVLMECAHDKQIAEVIDKFMKAYEKGVRLLLIAGPSASGKTTTANKLASHIKMRGLQPIVLSVDDYYKHRVDSPKDENGKYDFECLEALRIDDFNRHLLSLFNGEEIHPYKFDFVSGRYSVQENVTLKLPENGIIICEGIQGINPNFTPNIPNEKKFMLFIAPLAQIHFDEYNFMSHQVLRICRRIVRDYYHRNYGASFTLMNYHSVSKGEDKNILPYVKYANAIFNTSLDYEFNVLQTQCVPLLKNVLPDDDNYNLGLDTLELLQMCMPLGSEYIPKTSVIREFIGDGFYDQ